MKRSELAFVLIRVPLDALAMAAAFSLAYKVRFEMGVVYVWDFETFFRFILNFVPFWLVLFGLEGMYRIKSSSRVIDELAQVFLGVSSAVTLLVLWIFLSRTEFFSRLVVVYGFFFALIFVFGTRLALKYCQRYLLKFGIGVHRVVVFGLNGVAQSLVAHIQKNLKLGYELIKFLPVGRIEEFVNSPLAEKTDEIILADPKLTDAKVMKLIDFCSQRRIVFKMVPNLFRVHTINVDVSYIYSVPIIELRKSPLNGWWRIAKRAVDLAGALLAAVVLSPVLAGAAVAVKISSSGPVFYRNRRVGPNGIFSVLKFRSMYLEYCTGPEYGGKKAEAVENELIKKLNSRSGGIYKIKKDPRLTQVGEFIRRWSIDELPQIFNVLAGQMSLVGPRPHQLKEIKKYESDYLKLLHVKPGITGLAQISGRSDLNTEEEVRLDTYYLENWSLWLDFQIILRTPMAVLQKREVV